MDSFTYMTNPAYVGYKLKNMQYRNLVDIDNQYKWDVIYGLSPLTDQDIKDGQSRSDSWYSKEVSSMRRREIIRRLNNA